MITLEEFNKTHVVKTEFRTVNGIELFFFSCSICQFRRSHRHQVASYSTAIPVWNEQHFDFVANPFGGTISEWHEFPPYELNPKPVKNGDPENAPIEKHFFKIPTNYKELSEAEQKEFIKGLWLNMVNSLRKDK